MVAYVTGTVNQELLLRNGGGVGVEVGTASRVWQSHIYIPEFLLKNIHYISFGPSEALG